MRKRALFASGLVVLAAACGASAVPVSCFVVHADPTHVDAAAFQALVDLVALADQYRVPLTLLFTAQWAELILGDASKKTVVEGFLAGGHEIGAHHHAYWATQDQAAQWDGYTNTSLDQLAPADRLRFRGTMSDYWQLLSALPGIRDTGCMGLGEEDSADWTCGLRYSTFGHALADAVSEPTTITINGCSAIQIHHALLVEPEPGELASLYAATGDEELFAVVAHVSDYADRPSVVARWFQVLATQDADGARRATVAHAVQSWIES
jgi:hypothetical protein